MLYSKEELEEQERERAKLMLASLILIAFFGLVVLIL